MKKAVSNIWLKAAAMALLVVSVVVFAGSAAGIGLMEYYGIYEKSQEDLKKEWYEDICRQYSILALSDYQNDFNKEYLTENTNFEFGVMKTDDISDVDLNDEKSYVTRNFTGEVSLDDMAVNSWEINEDTEFYFSDEVCSMPFAIARVTQNEDTELEKLGVTDLYYAVNSGTVYVKTEDGKLYESLYSGMFSDYVRERFPESSDSGEAEETAGTDGEPDEVAYLTDVDGELDDASGGAAPYVLDILESGDSFAYQWEHPGRNAEIWPGSYVYLKDIKPVGDREISDMKPEDSGLAEMLSGNMVTVYKNQESRETVTYFVISRAREHGKSTGSFASMDLFERADCVLSLAYRLRFALIGTLPASLAVMLMTFCFLMCAAGHHRGYEGIYPYLLDHAPLDLYLIVDLGIAALFCLCTAVVADGLTNPGTSVVFWLQAGCLAAAGIVIFTGYCMSFAVNVKRGTWWRNTLCYKILRWCVRICTGVWRGLRRCAGAVAGSLPDLWKAWLTLCLLTLFELCAGGSGGEWVIACFAEKFAAFVLVTYIVTQLVRLQRGARMIATGKVDYRIHTENMFAGARRHGEYLNDIGNGIEHAVNARMKSERFKTELITNVSHDIKTPLTSIINYVDLLQKEEIENPKAQEYLGVLDRQCARLKKLIEDLIEASKASTGNLSVVMEKCDMSVVLTQTVGEFEEKLSESGIELFVQKPEETAFIEADSRHLWRVFDNLVGNMCKYSQPGTRAYINLEKKAGKVNVTFRNISKYQLNVTSEELLERFVRGDSSRNTEGSGLGLSIAQSLTTLMNGSFELAVDGDLFKVILAFPEYGGFQPAHGNNGNDSAARSDDSSYGSTAWPDSRAYAADRTAEDESFVLDRMRKGRDAFSGAVHTAGNRLKERGNSLAKRGKRFARRTGRFVQGVRQAAANLDDAPEDADGGDDRKGF